MSKIERPTFSLCYTSRRAHMIAPVIDLWKERCSDWSSVEVIISVDGDDQQSVEVADKIQGAVVAIQRSLPGNCVKGWNLAAEKSTGKVIIAVSDDFMPPVHWDKALLDLSPKTWIDEEWAVHVNDGFVKDIMTQAIITRKRYERFGYLYYPQYKSMYVDTDLTQRAILDGVVLGAMHLLFEHKHHDNGHRPQDAVDLAHSSRDRYAAGEQLYRFRGQVGYPIDAGPHYERVMKSLQEPGFDKYGAYIHAIKDDFCLAEVIDRMRAEGVRKFFIAIPDHYWDGRVTPVADIQQVMDISAKLKAAADGIDVQVSVRDVAKYIKPGRSRIEVETRVRNEALDWIRSCGVDHVLVVDGDELWRPGLLTKLDAFIRKRRPSSVKTGMVPAVGLPGYPVDKATDTATLYINTCDRFRDCRAPLHPQQSELPGYNIIHFTGVRRTMDEIVTKHRESGHYDDPDYDFEGFIQKLPLIKPGFKNVHMYKHYQIWPEIRHWTKSELEAIPESLHQYLGVETVIDDPVVAPAPNLQPAYGPLNPPL